MTKKTVLLIRPTGDKGGGMMCVADYLRDYRGWADGQLSFLEMDIRGQGSVLMSAWVFLLQARRLRKIAASRNVDVVHIFVGDYLSVLRKCAIARVAIKAGLPVLLHVHATRLPHFVERTPSFVRKWIGLTFAQAGAIVVLGPEMRGYLARTFSIAESLITIIPNGVPVPLQSDRTEPTSAVASILYLGNLKPLKGIDHLLQAMLDPCLLNLVQERRIRLILAGGGEIGRYRRIVAKLGIEEIVQFVGWCSREQVSSLLGSANVLILPSYAEAMPLVILEAFGHGVPVVTAQLAELESYPGAAKAVRRVRAGDSRSIAESISEVLTDRALSAELVGLGRALFRQHFTIEAFTGRIFDVYQRLVSPTG